MTIRVILNLDVLSKLAMADTLVRTLPPLVPVLSGMLGRQFEPYRWTLFPNSRGNKLRRTFAFYLILKS